MGRTEYPKGSGPRPGRPRPIAGPPLLDTAVSDDAKISLAPVLQIDNSEGVARLDTMPERDASSVAG